MDLEANGGYCRITTEVMTGMVTAHLEEHPRLLAFFEKQYEGSKFYGKSGTIEKLLAGEIKVPEQGGTPAACKTIFKIGSSGRIQRMKM